MDTTLDTVEFDIPRALAIYRSERSPINLISMTLLTVFISLHHFLFLLSLISSYFDDYTISPTTES